MDLEGLADLHPIRHPHLAERHLGRGRAAVRDRVELHAEIARAVRLGQHVAVGLHAVREEHGPLQVARHVQAVRELETWLDLPQARLNTLIDIIVQGHGALSKSKRKFVEQLNDEEIARIEEIVGRNFAEHIDASA